MAYAFGNIKPPLWTLRYIPDSQNGAWDNIGPRAPVGVCRHTMVGTLESTDSWFRRGASSTGLTDSGVGKDGRIWIWNDAWGLPHPGVSANRSGWANGGSDGLEGDGPLFVRTMGINGINRNLFSIERDDQGQPFDNPYIDPQALAIDRLIAFIFDQDKVQWDSYPINQRLGCVTDLFHKEFATKGCPWGPVELEINHSQDRVRGLLKAAQTGVSIEITPPPSPIVTDPHKLPEGYTLAGLETRFGKLRYVKLDGSVRSMGFDIMGPISNAWIARGVAEGRTMDNLPPAGQAADQANPKIMFDGHPAVATVVLFDGRGSDNWVLYRPDASIAWRWIV